jgi:hypothetical protein
MSDGLDVDLVGFVEMSQSVQESWLGFGVPKDVLSDVQVQQILRH